ncbi:unnamed protein product [Peronospora destructor]|uniref:AAA+ ATPase domain-containing protein n=1 Tax=Peronospora destructor TaxID=86335 RepID=A0AAV0UI66_9STRA|nr:unnamed protein product [Peronospora destructor]
MTKSDFGAAQAVVDVVFCKREPSWLTPLPNITPFNTRLNESQVEAISFALASKELALIHGPPGTGKTTTVVELILQAVTNYDLKVLVCAPSNIAVDNVLEKLASTCSTLRKKLRLTRVGHPARVLPQILQYCLDAKIQDAEGTEIVNDIRKEMTAMQTKLQKTRDKSVRFQLRRDMKVNRKEIRVREQKVVGEIVQHSNVVFATNVGAASKLLKDVTFDVVIIDEAAQALEASCWIPILKAKRCVLAGDHLQLPPTIKSKTAAAKGLNVTLFDRITSFPTTQSIVKMLNIQYRMHEDISEWSSQAMYKGKLKSFEGVAKRMLHELQHVNITKDDELLDATLLLLDTAGCELEEDGDDDDEGKEHSILRLSKSNEGEARVVARHVRALLAAGLKEDEVAVITPYNKQVQTLKALLLESYPKLEIRSVDGFQGCEKEAVVMSLVRSNASRQVGFLSDDRRMNVAITRAKRHVAVVCDTDTISSHKFLAALVNHFEKFGEYRSAQEYLEEDAVQGAVDEQLMLALSAPVAESEPSRASAAGSSSKSAAKAYHAKPKQKRNPKNDAKADLVPAPKLVEATQAAYGSQEIVTNTNPATGSGHVVDDEKKRSEDELEDKAAAATIGVFQRTESESENELEEEAPATKSTFQMMETKSDSSDDVSESSGHKEDVSEGEVSSDPSKISILEADPDLRDANSVLKDLHLSRLARQPVPPAPSSRKKNKTKKKKDATKAVKAAPIDELKDGEDELEFLTRQASKSLTCAFQDSNRCRKNITISSEPHSSNRRLDPQTQKKLTGDKRKVLKKKLKEQVGAKTASRTTQTKSKKK